MVAKKIAGQYLAAAMASRAMELALRENWITTKPSAVNDHGVRCRMRAIADGLMRCFLLSTGPTAFSPFLQHETNQWRPADFRDELAESEHANTHYNPTTETAIFQWREDGQLFEAYVSRRLLVEICGVWIAEVLEANGSAGSKFGSQWK